MAILNQPFCEPNGFSLRAAGFTDTITAGATKDCDYRPHATAIRYISGTELILANQAIGDNVDFQVVDKDNVLGYGAGTVLQQFGTNWHVSLDSAQFPVTQPFLGKIPGGVYIRVKYRSTGGSNVTMCCNLLLYEKA